ncbi:MAG: hypothetical protein HYY96_16175 [Candidatus Tectomicrobia bacterium]|nr:hypothetical protein [Candidatus Tectomicrobia bacterium]
MTIIHDWDEQENLEKLSEALPKERCIICSQEVDSDFTSAMVCDCCLWGDRLYKYLQYNKTLASGPEH